MGYLHIMVRMRGSAQSPPFDGDALDLKEIRRFEREMGRFTLTYLAASGVAARVSNTHAPALKLTYNPNTEHYGAARNWRHLALAHSPDLEFIELLQKGAALPPRGPCAAMSNTNT